MEPVTRDSPLQPLQAQIRELFGRTVYSHKTHEKCADICLDRLGRIKLTQIILSALTTGGIITVLLGDPSTSKIAAIISALLSTLLLALNAYTKDVDPGSMSQRHKEAAAALWGVRESYLSLLTDMHSGVTSPDDARTLRDDLQTKLAAIYESAPRTTSKGYKLASAALKVREDLTFSDQEIDQFLPGPLRSK